MYVCLEGLKYLVILHYYVLIMPKNYVYSILGCKFAVVSGKHRIN